MSFIVNEYFELYYVCYSFLLTYVHYIEECGVQHTHSNKMIIGTSEAENEMTSRAMKEVFDLGQYSQHPANCFAAVEVRTAKLQNTIVLAVLQKYSLKCFFAGVTQSIQTGEAEKKEFLDVDSLKVTSTKS